MQIAKTITPEEAGKLIGKKRENVVKLILAVAAAIATLSRSALTDEEVQIAEQNSRESRRSTGRNARTQENVMDDSPPIPTERPLRSRLNSAGGGA
ncbi:MAG TPA: hypothetical protein VGM05_22015 [Planctomycetaceae bacterium]|jgi:hypothetical protein